MNLCLHIIIFFLDNIYYVLCTGNNYELKKKKNSHNVEMNNRGILYIYIFDA